MLDFYEMITLVIFIYSFVLGIDWEKLFIDLVYVIYLFNKLVLNIL